MLKRPCLVFIAMTFATAAMADSYLCTAEHATGFAFFDEEWKSTSFKVAATKYLVQPLEKPQTEATGETFSYGLFRLGQNKPFFFCQGPESKKPVICKGETGQFKFDPGTGRYLYSYLRGYWDGVDGNENTPFIEIGKCSKV